MASDFLENKELKVMKKSKSGVKEADIRPYIYDFSAETIEKSKMLLKMCIAAGNEYNLKVDSVIDAMVRYTEGFEIDFFSTHREKILAGDADLL